METVEHTLETLRFKIIWVVLCDGFKKRQSLALQYGKLKLEACAEVGICVLLEWNDPFVLSMTHRRPS